MATWNHAQYMARLAHETTYATTERAMARLRQTLRDVEAHLTATEKDPEEEEWCALLSAWQRAADVAGLKSNG